MTTQADREKNQKLQEKYQAVLNGMLREEDNKYCVDCDSKGPRWASWNLGVFLCIRCAGIHRNLGVHISRVKSVNLDQWTAEQIASMQAMGNSKARAVYECNLPDNFRRSQTDSAMEQFIRQKYEQRKYIAKEWIPPNITISPDFTDDEKEKDKKKTTTKSNANKESRSGGDTKAQASSNQVKLNLNINAAASNGGTKKQSQPQSQQSNGAKPVSSSDKSHSTASDPKKPSADLLNLFDDPVPANSGSANSNVSLFDSSNLIDIDKQQDSNAKALGELSLGNDAKPPQAKIDKNSILALYSNTKPAADSSRSAIPTSTSVNSFDGFSSFQSNAQLLQSQIQMTPSSSQNFMPNPAFYQQQQAPTPQQLYQLQQLQLQQQQQQQANFMNKSAALPQNQLFNDLSQLAMRSTNGPSNSQIKPMQQPTMGSLFDNRAAAAAAGAATTNKPANIGNTLSSNLWD